MFTTIIILIFIIILLLIVTYKLYNYKILFKNFSDGISIIQNDQIVDCNDTLVELFKYKSKKDFLTAHPLHLSPAFQPDGKLSFEKSNDMIELARKNGKCKFDWVFLTINNQEKYIEIDIFRMKKDRYCMVWRDIDKRIEVEKKLKEFNDNLELTVQNEIKKNQEQEKLLFFQSKMAQLGEMISMIAHQWRQPLCAISSTVINVQMKIAIEKNDEKLMQFIEQELDDIEGFTQTLTKTIDDFRDFYKNDYKFEKLNINQAISKAYGIVKTPLSYEGIKVNFDKNSQKHIDIIENEIIQVFLNLFENSKQNFIEKGIKNPIINITTSDTNDGVKIKFLDNGLGVDDSILDKIFDPYFSTKQEKNGTGLGLYMSLKIIKEHHQGDIKVSNTNDGLCFEIDLKELEYATK